MKKKSHLIKSTYFSNEDNGTQFEIDFRIPGEVNFSIGQWTENHEAIIVHSFTLTNDEAERLANDILKADHER